jgi:hypothetical protein
MLGKPWDQMSIEEKVEQLHRQIDDILGRSNINVETGSRELKAIKDRLDKLEKPADPADSEETDPQKAP